MMIMILYETFCFLLIVIHITKGKVVEQQSTDRLEATDSTIAFRIVNCFINSTNTTLVNKVYIL